MWQRSSRTDPTAKISGLEAFLTQYPNSVMKNQALEILMGTYQQANNAKKTMETATKLVTADPCNVRALTLLAYFDRVMAQGGDPNGKQLSGGRKEIRPAGTRLPAEVQQARRHLGRGFHEDEGPDDRDLQRGHRDRGVCRTRTMPWRRTAPEARRWTRIPDSQRISALVYPLALAYLGQTPPDYQNGIWYRGARRGGGSSGGPGADREVCPLAVREVPRGRRRLGGIAGRGQGERSADCRSSRLRLRRSSAMTWWREDAGQRWTLRNGNSC